MKIRLHLLKIRVMTHLVRARTLIFWFWWRKIVRPLYIRTLARVENGIYAGKLDGYEFLPEIFAFDRHDYDHTER